jgi:hypothetical protein
MKKNTNIIPPSDLATHESKDEAIGESDNTHQNNHNNHTSILSFITGKPFSNLALVVFTFGLLIASILQWCAISKNTIISQRAWIVVKNAEYGFTSPLVNKIAVKLIFTNSGNTPILGFKISGNAEIRNEQPKNVYDSIGKLQKRYTINDKDITQIIELETEVSKGTMAGLSSGSINLYVWGFAEYTDVFNEKRTTEFCFVSSKDTQTMKPCEGLNRLN